MEKKDYLYGGYSGFPFTEEDLEIVTDELKELFVEISKRRYPRTSRLAANAMIGAIATLLSNKPESPPNTRCSRPPDGGG